jgi:hypothetical protein
MMRMKSMKRSEELVKGVIIWVYMMFLVVN